MADRLGRRGAAVVEFALAAPLLLALLSGIVTYGGWFWAAHEVQQAANEAARATLAGLDAAERRRIAIGAVNRTLAGSGALSPAAAQTGTSESSEMVTVRVTYDMAGSRLGGFGLVPVPATAIHRSATVRLDTP